MHVNFLSLVFISGLLFSGSCRHLEHSDYYGILILDSESGRPIPMIEVRLLDQTKYYTDNAGYMAFREEGLMDRDLYFQFSSAGYYFPYDKDGRPGKTLHTRPGEIDTVELTRTNVAQRLYRSTGRGLLQYGARLGVKSPSPKQVINSGVLGQDSNLSIPYRGKIFWLWGDTFLPETYQGNFSVAAAWTDTSEVHVWSETGPAFDYILNASGETKKMINLDGPGYVWFDWLMKIPSEEGTNQLVAKYARVNAQFGNFERGIAIYNDEESVFEKYKSIDQWIDQPHQCDHPFSAISKGVKWRYLTSEFNLQRVRPTLNSLSDPVGYESYSCFVEGTGLDGSHAKVERDAAGKIVYGWKRNTATAGYPKIKTQIESGGIKPEESWLQLMDVETGSVIEPGRGSIYWNTYRQRWILMAGSKDLWYAEADTPVGPWQYARRVAVHDHFFYNPHQHPFLDAQGGQIIYMEGTFTKFFSKEPEIPMYDYNQLMYSLDLSDKRCILPIPVYTIEDPSYRLSTRPSRQSARDAIHSLPFLALDRPPADEGIIPIFRGEDSPFRLSLQKSETDSPLFYAIRSPVDTSRAFVGQWKVQMNFLSFDNSVTIDIQNEEGTWQVDSEKASFLFSDLLVDGLDFSIGLLHENVRYLCKGLLSNGKIEGTWAISGSDRAGSWEAEASSDFWWPQLGAGVKPLYEQKDETSGNYIYTTSRPSHGNPQEPEVLPICLVWENPAEVLPLDWDIEMIDL